MLNRARERARAVSQQGALFPWRTINGEEASSNFQAGTAQYHTNADIAYAIRRNASITGDMRLLGDVGAEILAETARLWRDLGFYGRDGTFHIHGVTGPDEYTTVRLRPVAAQSRRGGQADDPAASQGGRARPAGRADPARAQRSAADRGRPDQPADGKRLFMSEKTVKTYVSAMFRKLGLEQRTQAAAYAARTFDY